jgi:hypothetical protein
MLNAAELNVTCGADLREHTVPTNPGQKFVHLLPGPG